MNGLKALILSYLFLFLINRYLPEMEVLAEYPYAWCDVSYQETTYWSVYSTDVQPSEYDCILGKGKTEGEAWENAAKNLSKNLCYKYKTE